MWYSQNKIVCKIVTWDVTDISVDDASKETLRIKNTKDAERTRNQLVNCQQQQETNIRASNNCYCYVCQSEISGQMRLNKHSETSY